MKIFFGSLIIFVMTFCLLNSNIFAFEEKILRYEAKDVKVSVLVICKNETYFYKIEKWIEQATYIYAHLRDENLKINLVGKIAEKVIKEGCDFDNLSIFISGGG